MAYDKKTWRDRQSQYPSRRKLIETNLENVFETERAEGEVTEAGNRFDAENMNDFEARVENGFGSIIDSDVTVQDKNNHFASGKLDGVLNELYTFAMDGKTKIANAIGGTQGGIALSSMSFDQLATLITNYTTPYLYKNLRQLGYDEFKFSLVTGHVKTITIDLPVNFAVRHLFLNNFSMTYYSPGLIGEFILLQAYNPASIEKNETINYGIGADVTTRIEGKRLFIITKAKKDITFTISASGLITAFGELK